jgi:hypothetical protein
MARAGRERWAGPVLACLILGAGGATPEPAWAQQPVELELVLAVDVSVSVDPAEYALQIAGLAFAIRDPNVQAAIAAVGNEGIAVSVIQWGEGLQQRVAIGWHHLVDAPSIEVFARAVEKSPRHFSGNGTSISAAMAFAARTFDGNGFAGRRRVIDVSGDGRNNSGLVPPVVRDRLVAQGFVINGLAILDGDDGLGLYFQNEVIGGTASFVVTAVGFEDFAEAMRRKLLHEIQAPVVSAPASGEPAG